MTGYPDHTSKYLPDELIDQLDWAEWEARPGYLELQCGHKVWVKPGDTVWLYMDEEDDRPLFFAVDPVTIQ